MITKTAKAIKLPEIERGSSPSGFHYVNLFQNCPRKWYLRWYLRWKPRSSSLALLQGAAFHYAKAVFLATGSAAKARSELLRYLTVVRHEFENEKDQRMASARLPTMLTYWIAKFGNADLRTYKFIEVEGEHKIVLPGGFVFTVRLDALAINRMKDIIIFETKTSSWRPELTEIDVAYGDQATAYIAVAKELYRKASIYVAPDIMSWPKNCLAVEKINAYRGELVERKDHEIDEWKTGMATLLSEISQRSQAVADGKYSPFALFPRNTQYCTAFSHACEYLNVCRECIDAGVVPHGFVYDKEGKK